MPLGHVLIVAEYDELSKDNANTPGIFPALLSEVPGPYSKKLQHQQRFHHWLSAQNVSPPAGLPYIQLPPVPSGPCKSLRPPVRTTGQTTLLKAPATTALSFALCSKVVLLLRVQLYLLQLPLQSPPILPPLLTSLSPPPVRASHPFHSSVPGNPPGTYTHPHSCAPPALFSVFFCLLTLSLSPPFHHRSVPQPHMTRANNNTTQARSVLESDRLLVVAHLPVCPPGLLLRLVTISLGYQYSEAWLISSRTLAHSQCEHVVRAHNT